jgi:hypothetical protein
VAQALRALGIRQILALSPQARGRSERAFGTLQGRLPQELRLHHITDYERANRYLDEVFVPDFNRRFSVPPAQKESAFVKLAGIELELVLSSKHERVVRNDNTVAFQGMVLQLPTTRYRSHFVRCAVTVHRFSNDTLGISYQGRLLARYDSAGQLLGPDPHKERAATAQRWAGENIPAGAPPSQLPARIKDQHFSARAADASESAGEKMLLIKPLQPQTAEEQNHAVLQPYSST